MPNDLGICPVNFAYLHYILTRYNSLPEHITFIQGDPMPHGNHIFNLLCMKKYYAPVQSISSWYSYKPEERHLYEDSKNILCGAQSSRFRFDVDYTYLPRKTHKYPFFGGRCTAPLNKFKKDCSIINKNYNYVFLVAGIFSVSRQRILNNGIQLYSRIITILLSKNTQGGREGYALEFFWATIFGE